MDESVYEQAQRLTERRTQAAIEAARSCPQETPCEVDGIRVCLDCDAPIAEARLAAYPRAVRCISCQEDHDQRARRG